MKIRITVLISLLIILTLPMLGAHAGGIVTICDEASLDAALAGGGAVTFSCSGTITITSTKVISADTTIDGTGQTVTISGGGTVRVFEVNAGVTLNLDDLTVSDGFDGGGGGGGILSYGTVNISGSTFSNNSVSGVSPVGGAIYNVGGALDISDSTFSGNISNGPGASAIMNLQGPLTITNTIFTGNTHSGSDGGGALYNNAGTADITGSTFSNNSTNRQGGAILNGGGGGTATLTVSNSIFSGNTAGVLGGAIHNGCIVGSCVPGITGNTTISDSTFSNNSAPEGGAISHNVGTVDISDSTISDNIASNNGGGIFNSGGILNVVNSTISNNAAGNAPPVGVGGGIVNINGSTLTIENSSILDNSALNSGGGIYNVGAAGATISNSTISGNYAGSNNAFVGNGGGGIAHNNGTMTITNSTVSSNSADVAGGGIIVVNIGTLIVENSTVANNSSDYGGGIDSDRTIVQISNSTIVGNSASVQGGGLRNRGATGGLTIKNSIVANSPSGNDCFNSGNFTASALNFDTDGTCPGFTQSSALNLDALANNGGPTQTIALIAGSAAIDAAADCTTIGGVPLTTDQRGVARPIDGDGDSSAVCDVGAFEAPALGNAVSDFVVLGHEGIHLQQNSVVNSGDVGANDASSGPFLAEGSEVTIGIGVDILDPVSRVMGDTVTVKQGAQIYDVYYNEISGNGQILGQQFTPVDLPLVDSFPTVPTFTPGTQDFDVAQNGNLTLNTGSYGTLLARLDSTITFTGGVYDFAEWDVRDSVDLLFEAPSEIRIAGKLSVDQGSFVGPSPTATGLGASDIVIFVTGQNGSNGNLGATPKAAKFGINSTVIANVYAPNGTLWLRQGTVATGAFLGRWVDIGIGVELTLDSGFGGGGFALMAASAECSLNPDFWLANPDHSAWAQLSNGTDTAFLTSGVTYQEVLSAPGSPYYTLAQSYVAAELALLNGANPFNANGEDIRQTLRYAYNVLSSAQGDQLSPEYDSDAQRLANQLNRYLSSINCLS